MASCAAIFFMATKHRHIHNVLQPFIVALECRCRHCGHRSKIVVYYNVFCCSKTLGVVVDHCGGHCGGHCDGHLVLPPNYM